MQQRAAEHPSDAIPISTFPGVATHEVLEQKSYPVNKRVFFLSLLAIANAMLVGLIAKVLVGLISLITNIAFYGSFSLEEHSPAGNHLGLAVILLPVAGGLIVGVMARFGSPAIRGHGIPEAMEQILVNESRIKPIIIFLKPISAAISIGTGGPFGAEGPIISTGGAFGSFLGQLLRVTPNERKIILAAGACAGMSAIFGTPLAAILLAIELLLFEFSPRSIIPVALSCCTGAAAHFVLFGTEPVFAMPTIPEPGSLAMVTYVVMGIVIGLAAAVVSKSVYLIEDLFERLPMHWMWWPAIGALAVGIVGYFAPLTLGVGYSNIQHLLSNTVPFSVLLTLCFLKFVSWSVSLGSGTSGGTLAPLLTIGGAFGGLLYVAAHQLFPGSGINAETCALIGMGAMFAGASRALLTSIVFAVECTMQPHGLLPLIGACTASYFVSFFLMKGSIMTEKMERRGVASPHSLEADILQRVKAGDVINEEVTALSASDTVKDARYWIKENADAVGQATTFVVVNDNGGLAGTVKRKDLFDKKNDDKVIQWLIDANAPFVFEENKLNLAVDLMAKCGTDLLPVIAPGEARSLIGVLTHKEIFDAYSRRRHESENYQTAISLRRRSIRVILKGRQLFGK